MRNILLTLGCILAFTAAAYAATWEGQVRGIERNIDPFGRGQIDTGDFYFLSSSTVCDGWPEGGEVAAGQRVCAAYELDGKKTIVTRMKLLSMGDVTIHEGGCSFEDLGPDEKTVEGVVCLASRGSEGTIAAILVGWQFTVTAETVFEGRESFGELRRGDKVKIDYTVTGARNFAKRVRVSIQ